MLADYLDAMLIETAETVLDLGCGTGMVARAIARFALDHLLRGIYFYYVVNAAPTGNPLEKAERTGRLALFE